MKRALLALAFVVALAGTAHAQAQSPIPIGPSGGASILPAACSAHQWISALSAGAVPTCTQPAFTDISGSVAAAQMPALTGDCTTSAGAVATTCTKTNGVAFATSATTDTTNASNISSGTLPNAQVPAPGNTGATLGGTYDIYAEVALQSSSPSFSNATVTQIAFDTVLVDSSSAWNATNHDFLFTKAGTYFVCLWVTGSASSSWGTTATLYAVLYKNKKTGTFVGEDGAAIGVSSGLTGAAHDCAFIALNGSTDVIDGNAEFTAGGGTPSGTTIAGGATNLTHMTVHYVGP